MRDFQPIENYGAIGDLETVALVGIDGSIDFFCSPAFDSPSIFAALLDCDGGRFSIRPVADQTRHKQLYLPDTNILITRFLSKDGDAELTDAMPLRTTGEAPRIIRSLKVVRGSLDFELVCQPRFDYRRKQHRAELVPDGVRFHCAGSAAVGLLLRSSVPLATDSDDLVLTFRLAAGEEAWFVLDTLAADCEPLPVTASIVAQQMRSTADYWRNWIGRSNYRGRWREVVDRSALVLKLLTSAQYGSIAAAATFGLPEEIGGARNWDYRYTWIRDASFTLYAFIRLGFMEEAEKFMRWITTRAGEAEADGTLRIMYRMDGGADIEEETLQTLGGYRNSKPVRVGNGAYRQRQLDIYGELLDAVYLANKYGRGIAYDDWLSLVRTLDWVCEHWQEPDAGIWEVRGPEREFLHSRLLCWVALDRGIRLAAKRSLPAPLEPWMKTRADIHGNIYSEFWNDERQAFMQYRGADRLDAAALLMPLLRFVSPADRRWTSTLRAIGTELASGALVFRYRNGQDESSDGLTGSEGSFTTCSFWYIEALARSGDVAGARLLFEKMIGYGNHLGLYSEELGPSGEHLGNFPQALTHLALISAAFYLDRAMSGRPLAPWSA